jgi:hypothetical protein
MYKHDLSKSCHGFKSYTIQLHPVGKIVPQFLQIVLQFLTIQQHQFFHHHQPCHDFSKSCDNFLGSSRFNFELHFNIYEVYIYIYIFFCNFNIFSNQTTTSITFKFQIPTWSCLVNGSVSYNVTN